MRRVEFRLTVTIAEHGWDPKNGDLFLRGFVETHPEVGAVVDQNTKTGTLSVTFSFDAADLLEAMRLGSTIFADGAAASGLPVTSLTDVALAAEVHISPVPGHELSGETTRQLQPA